MEFIVRQYSRRFLHKNFPFSRRHGLYYPIITDSQSDQFLTITQGWKPKSVKQTLHAHTKFEPFFMQRMRFEVNTFFFIPVRI